MTTKHRKSNSWLFVFALVCLWGATLCATLAYASDVTNWGIFVLTRAITFAILCGVGWHLRGIFEQSREPPTEYKLTLEE